MKKIILIFICICISFINISAKFKYGCVTTITHTQEDSCITTVTTTCCSGSSCTVATQTTCY